MNNKRAKYLRKFMAGANKEKDENGEIHLNKHRKYVVHPPFNADYYDLHPNKRTLLNKLSQSRHQYRRAKKIYKQLKSEGNVKYRKLD